MSPVITQTARFQKDILERASAVTLWFNLHTNSAEDRLTIRGTKQSKAAAKIFYLKTHCSPFVCPVNIFQKFTCSSISWSCMGLAWESMLMATSPILLDSSCIRTELSAERQEAEHTQSHMFNKLRWKSSQVKTAGTYSS